MSRVLRRAQKSVQKRTFDVGQDVEALWTDNRFYPATVTSVDKGLVLLDGRGIQEYSISASKATTTVEALKVMDGHGSSSY